MANHVSALKRARQTEHKTDVNRANSSKLRSALRSAKESLAAGDPKSAQAAYQSCISILDKSVRKGTLHKNTAARLPKWNLLQLTPHSHLRSGGRHIQRQSQLRPPRTQIIEDSIQRGAHFFVVLFDQRFGKFAEETGLEFAIALAQAQLADSL